MAKLHLSSSEHSIVCLTLNDMRLMWPWNESELFKVHQVFAKYEYTYADQYFLFKNSSMSSTKPYSLQLVGMVFLDRYKGPFVIIINRLGIWILLSCGWNLLNCKFKNNCIFSFPHFKIFFWFVYKIDYSPFQIQYC